MDNFDVIIEVDSIATIRNLVKKDVGVSILSKGTCYKEIRKGSLVALPVENLSRRAKPQSFITMTFTHTEMIERIAKVYGEVISAQP